MATGHLLDTKTVNLNGILGNGKIYRVPQFQRDYSWGQDNWEDLWNDIEIAEKTATAHYMGSVVLQSTTGKEYLIIDGQQRFTTLTIITLAVIAAIQKLADNGIDVEENRERVDILMRQYIGQKDPASLSYSSKLFLNENNDGFFQTRLVSFREPIKVTKLSDSEKLMWDAYIFFKQRINQKFRANSGGELASFLNNIAGELMMFIQITVEDELNAYTVFETLNSRGVELTSTDLLKNFLFSLVAKSETDLKQVKAQWKKIIDTIGLKEFPVFLRYFLIATRKQITKEYLFKEIKQFVKTGQDVFDLLDKLEYYAYNYVALGNPDDELWNMDKDNRTAISILKSFRVSQWKPLAMVSFEKLNNSDFKRLLQSIISLSFRYNIIAKLQTNEMEKVYSRSAINLYSGSYTTLPSVLNDLKALYVPDDDFKNYFSLKQFNTNNSTDKKLLRYTLYKLESQEENGSLYDYETDNGTIEHILPESYPETWNSEFTEEEFERNVCFIGNLTLLEPSKNNREAADKTFSEKKEVYSSSKYALTNRINDPHWTSQNIKSRQVHLARLATAIWKIQF
ncbi:MAG: DUF262 domain-containing HNH endonuclease family protein [Bacteroidales bacterium]|nr:DUF262 domain-containing HNH endonuclease family protein [Bacteroidales bacterium]